MIRSNLKILRENKGISQRELERQIGIPHQYISLMEDKRLLATREEALRLCEYFGTTFDFLYPDPEIRKLITE